MESTHNGLRLRFLSERSLTSGRRELLANASEATFLQRPEMQGTWMKN